MKNISASLVVLFLSVLSTTPGPAVGATPPAHARQFPRISLVEENARHIKQTPNVRFRTGVAHLPASVTSDVFQTACRPEAADLGASAAA